MRTIAFAVGMVGLALCVALTSGAVAATPTHQDAGVPAGESAPVAPLPEEDRPAVGAPSPDGDRPSGESTPGASADPGDDRCAPFSNGSARPDPDTDRLGWEDGCWHDERLRINYSDGLNDTELAAVVARTKARVESIRRLEFEGDAPLAVLSREEFEREVTERLDASETKRLRTNVLWEALMMVGEDTDAFEVLESNSAGSAGYYDPTRGRMVVVVDNPEEPRVLEQLLAHELVHVLQDQHFDAADRFDLSTFERTRTKDSQNAILSLIEGESVFVEILYAQRCGTEWNCATATPSDPSVKIHRGLSFLNGYSYLDGRKLIHEVYEDGGWEAVNDLYENPPESTGQVIAAESYPDGAPPPVEFTDRSDDDWRIPAAEGDRPDYETVGIPGLTSMFVYTVYDTNRQQSAVVPLRAFNNFTGNGLDTFDPYRYENNPYAAGWNGDRLYPYVTGDSAEDGETGYVWKIEFETRNDSEAFVEGYTETLAYYNASPVDGRANTYRIPDQDRFGDAYYVNRTGSTVVVVNAPTVADLSGVRAGAAPETGDGGVPVLPRTPVEWSVLLGAAVLVVGAVVAWRALAARDE